ncbi:MAG: glutamyl-tRNA reductase [Candidatus Omnitrophica bacterium]|nr:glutamyl-tRNA reductase [Candidatus Omnitrophota bacterium]
MADIVLVGINYRTAPIELRERLAFRAEHLAPAYAELQGAGLPEALILSTCNRVELYAGTPAPEAATRRMMTFLQLRGGFSGAEGQESFYAYREPRAVQHLFQVVSGLDSMVLGEAEILHQVKQAYEWAKEHGATGKVLNGLFQKALNAGKAVRTQTAIGRGGMSVGTVAIELAQKIFGDLRPYTVLLLGAGKIGEVTLKRLMARGASQVRIANRSADRAAAVARRHGARAVPWEHLEQQLIEADIVLASCSVEQPLVTGEQLHRLMSQRRQRPLCLIDLGVPRNIEPSAGRADNVYLFDIDDLQELVAHHHGQRQQAAGDAQTILDHKVRCFLAWHRQQERRAACAPSASELVGAR